MSDRLKSRPGDKRSGGLSRKKVLAAQSLGSEVLRYKKEGEEDGLTKAEMIWMTASKTNR